MPTKKTTGSHKVVNEKSTSHHGHSHKAEFEKKIDKMMAKLQKKVKYVQKVMDLDFIHKVLSSKIVNNTNKWVKTNLDTITKIIWRVMVVFWAIWLLTTLGTIWILLAYFKWGFILILLLNLVYVIIGMLLGFGLIKMKKRTPFFATFLAMAYIAYFIIAVLFGVFKAIPSPRTIIFYIIFMIYILKNQEAFNQ